MKLTKQQAIEGHRKMWNWIADEIAKDKSTYNIPMLKILYCKKNKLVLLNRCFCCEYSSYFHVCCEKCPVDWVKTEHCNDNEKSLYRLVADAITWQKQAELARTIANLPEKIDIEENAG